MRVVVAAVFVILTAGLPAASAQPATSRDGIIVALGASNTAGKGVRASEAFPAQLEVLLREKGFDVAVLNAGINGDTTDRMLGRLDHAVPEGTRIVILQPGGNDRRKGYEPLRADNIREIERRLAARNVRVVMLENAAFGRFPHQNDGEHLTADGYRQLAEHLLPEVVAALQAAGAHGAGSD
jgi:acyl-CoA thioesterase-1